MRTLFVLLTISIFIACSKERSFERPDVTPPIEVAGQWDFAGINIDEEVTISYGDSLVTTFRYSTSSTQNDGIYLFKDSSVSGNDITYKLEANLQVEILFSDSSLLADSSLQNFQPIVHTEPSFNVPEVNYEKREGDTLYFPGNRMFKLYQSAMWTSPENDSNPLAVKITKANDTLYIPQVFEVEEGVTKRNALITLKLVKADQ